MKLRFSLPNVSGIGFVDKRGHSWHFALPHETEDELEIALLRERGCKEKEIPKPEPEIEKPKINKLPSKGGGE